MKILLIHDFYRQFGGEDAVALAERNLLLKNSQEVIEYYRRNDETSEFSIGDWIAFPARTIYSERTRKDISEVLRSDRPDIAFIHNVFPLISPSIYHVLHQMHVPIAQVIHDFRFLCPNGWFYTQGEVCERCKHGNYLNAIRFRCYRNSYLLSGLYAAAIGFNRIRGMLGMIDGFICLTEFSMQKLSEVGIPDRKIYLRPNFIDSQPVAMRTGQEEYVAYLGRLSEEKGITTLVKAFQDLEGIKLKIAGSGPLEAEIRNIIQAKALTNIELVGFKKGAQKWEFLRHALCTVVPSHWYENFPMVVLESYAAGRPVIGSKLGSLPYVIEPGKTGLLFEPGNPADLRRKVLQLLETPDRRMSMGKQARKLAETKYSPERGFEKLMNIFDAIISGAVQ
jgi:glycosyltransferase involved in cell wall biosynthesis